LVKVTQTNMLIVIRY